jgi:glutathione S-transferase
MLKLWGRATSSNVQKVMWAIAETGTPVERIDVGGKFGGLDSAAYGAMNPNRLVPTLQDGSLTMWESNACVRCVAARYCAGSLWPSDPAERAASDMWMDWAITSLGPDWSAVFYGVVRTAPSKQDKPAIAAAVKRLSERYAVVDRQLSGKTYMTGPTLGLADFAIGFGLYRYYTMDIERPALANIDAYYRRLTERPAYARHVMVDYSDLRVTD